MQPIYKRKGDISCPQNHRPIALLPSLSKVFETFVHNQLLQYCLYQGCLPDERYGFLLQRSTTWQLLTIVNEWHEALDRGEAVHTLFVDIAKAFDRVDHSLLLLKLASIGVCGDQLDWFESYLRGRSISTVVDGQLSSLLSISSAVPQGSVLGLLLFVICFRDLPPVLLPPRVSLLTTHYSTLLLQPTHSAVSSRRTANDFIFGQTPGTPLSVQRSPPTL